MTEEKVSETTLCLYLFNHYFLRCNGCAMSLLIRISFVQVWGKQNEIILWLLDGGWVNGQSLFVDVSVSYGL